MSWSNDHSWMLISFCFLTTFVFTALAQTYGLQAGVIAATFVFYLFGAAVILRHAFIFSPYSGNVITKKEGMRVVRSKKYGFVRIHESLIRSEYHTGPADEFHL